MLTRPSRISVKPGGTAADAMVIEGTRIEMGQRRGRAAEEVSKGVRRRIGCAERIDRWLSAARVMMPAGWCGHEGRNVSISRNESKLANLMLFEDS